MVRGFLKKKITPPAANSATESRKASSPEP
jgi:hypothetical protein